MRRSCDVIHPDKAANAIAASAPGGATVVQELEIEDQLDIELLDIFLEEGRDLLPQIGECLYKLQRAPADRNLIHCLLRPLHTIKGSARMAGAMRLGQHMHDLESRIGEIDCDGELSNGIIDELLALYDVSLHLFENLQTAAISDVASQPSAVCASAKHRHEPDETVVNSASIAPLVRIRTGVLDRLLNQAGEISISRCDLETQLSVLREHLNALGSNVARLDNFLRQSRMHAEIQATVTHHRQAQDPYFDPLELDRFTQLHELTRMLAESVDDVGTLQKNLLDTVNHAQDSLIQQGRMTQGMQRELMHVRMVQFKELEERLHRLVRQLAKETGKQLQLHIAGGTVELDRSILENMIGPLEHLLRNSAAHGIETQGQRHAAGKDLVGQLILEVRQEGNEALICLSDDGTGLDLGRIREKATEQAMIWAGEEVSDIELMSAIFHPGFTTNSNVTAIAGRGVGLDVVRSEVLSLGGRISVNTVAGEGVQFTIRLPLSLAVAQVVLFESGSQSYAIPSLLVAQVLQMKRPQQEEIFRSGVLEWQHRKLPVFHLSDLLGDSRSTTMRETAPVLLVKNDHDFLAILVDHVIGNREIITKSIGPQLTYMTGVVGAAVLGSGSIVLILNPLQLAQRHVHRRRERHVGHCATCPDETKKTVLVVDDSLTVRRVMHSLLTREGYQVVLASDGVDALHQLQSDRPDMVLLDIEMPRMDGFDLTRHIRAMYDVDALPIVAITSRIAAKHRKRALELGINAYLGKPYQADVLLKTVRNLTEPG